MQRLRLSKYTIFILGMGIMKVLLMTLFSSEYQENLFFPFVVDYVKNGGNVYQRAFEKGMTDSLPYPPVMLYIQLTGVWLVNFLRIENTYLIRFFFKLPSLVLDYIGLQILTKFYPHNRKQIAILYYASPIILYAVFMHGQLDLIPMVFIMLALFFLTSKKKFIYRCFYGSMFTAIAMLTKMHILSVLPIIFFYIRRRDGLRRALVYIGVVCVQVFLGMIPFWSEGFQQIVLLNKQQNVLTQVSLHFATVDLYLPIVVVLFVYLQTFKMGNINKELFLNLCGIVFAIFLVFCPPMPGWYIWIVPFMTLFFLFIKKEKTNITLIYAGLNVLYLIYFVFLHHRKYVDLYGQNIKLSFILVDNAVLSNIFFTLLSGVLMSLILSMYQLGVTSNNLYKRKNAHFTLGIAGDSGSGKSTMIQIIQRGLGYANVLYLEGDGDHKWERGSHFWEEYTSLNPKSNYLYRQADDIRKLRTGETVNRVDYDHDTGKFTLPKKMYSKKYLILCGLHSFYLPQARKKLDLKIYMDSDETLRRYWKIQRDMNRRGYSKEAIIHSIEKRIPDAIKYIYPQKKYADLIIRYFDRDLKNCMEENHQERISVEIRFSIEIEVEPILDILKHYGIHSSHEYSGDLKTQVVIFEADNLEGIHLPIERIATALIPQLEELTCEEFKEIYSAKDGIVILFLLLLISNKMRGGD